MKRRKIDVKKENARLREALNAFMSLKMERGFSSSIDDREYCQVEIQFWNDAMKKAKKALEEVKP